MALKGNKILNLKKWITLEQAATALSTQFSEEVSVSDIYQLALEGQIKISVNLYNHATVKFGRTHSIDDATVIFSIRSLLFNAPFLRLSKSESDNLSLSSIVRMILDDSDGSPSKSVQKRIAENDSIPPEIKSYFYSSTEQERDDWASAIASSPKCKFSATYEGFLLPNKTEIMEVESKVQSIDGFWDLPMIGSEALDILHALHSIELAGEEVSLTNLEGAWLKNPESDEWAQLQESFADNEYCTPEERKAYREKPMYYPAGGLPQDATLVIRTPEFQRFIQDLSDEPKTSSKTENMQRKVIRSLAIALNGADLPEILKESDATRFIEHVKSDFGTEIPCSAKALAKYMASFD